MLSRIATCSLRRRAVRPVSASTRTLIRPVLASTRTFTTLDQVLTADDAWKKSGYVEIDYTISEEAAVYDAVQRFAAFNIGCLVTTDKSGSMTGIISERDYISKIALLGRTSKETKIKEIATRATKLVTAKLDESVEDCMAKMLTKDIRHLPLVNEDSQVVGMISIKDLVKTTLQEEKTIKVLSDFALGKGGHFGSD